VTYGVLMAFAIGMSNKSMARFICCSGVTRLQYAPVVLFFS